MGLYNTNVVMRLDSSLTTAL